MQRGKYPKRIHKHKELHPVKAHYKFFIGDYLKRLRFNAGLTQLQASILIGISERYLWQLEKGDKPRCVSPATALKIARVYKVFPKHLYKVFFEYEHLMVRYKWGKIKNVRG